MTRATADPLGLALYLIGAAPADPYWGSREISHAEAEILATAFPRIVHRREGGDTGWLTPEGERPGGVLVHRFETEWEGDERLSIGIFDGGGE